MSATFRYALLIGAACLATPGLAVAAEPGPYVGVGIGLSIPEDSGAQAQIPTGARAINFEGDFDTGFIGIGSVGYKWDKGFRTELEVSYRQADFDKINGAAANGTQGVYSTSANLLYDFNTNSPFTPYLGAGLGLAVNKWNNVVTAGFPVFTDTSTILQWQGIAGVSIRIREGVEAFADYRYIGLGTSQFGSRPAGSLVTGHADRSNNIVVGLRFALGHPTAAPVAQAQMPNPSPMMPPPPAPPAAIAAPPPIPSKFLVFFDFDKSDLRADAEKVVNAAADYTKKNGAATIVATGYTDTVGTAGYNMGLSERRAEAVKAALVKLGISDKEIVVKWKGKSDLLVPTGDDVREPQNRRVEIIFE